MSNQAPPQVYFCLMFEDDSKRYDGIARTVTDSYTFPNRHKLKHAQTHTHTHTHSQTHIYTQFAFRLLILLIHHTAQNMIDIVLKELKI